MDNDRKLNALTQLEGLRIEWPVPMPMKTNEELQKLSEWIEVNQKNQAALVRHSSDSLWLLVFTVSV